MEDILVVAGVANLLPGKRRSFARRCLWSIRDANGFAVATCTEEPLWVTLLVVRAIVEDMVLLS